MLQKQFTYVIRMERTGGIMINFDDEVAKFKPCLEIEEVEDNVNNNELADIIDIIEEAVKEKNSVIR